MSDESMPEAQYDPQPRPPHIFASQVYQSRIHRAAAACDAAGLAGLIIGTGAEFAYFTGSWISTHERLTALIIPAASSNRGALVIAPETDLADLAKPELSATSTLDIQVRGWVDGDNAHELAVSHLTPALAMGNVAVGLGESLTTNHVLKLQELLSTDKPVRTVLTGHSLQDLFFAKDDQEVEQLRGAACAIDRVHAQVPELLRAGRTEAEIAQDIERLILCEHDVVDFIIVGSGPNGANPHHSFSERVLEQGDVVVVDIGGTFGVGYHSDCTRTYVVGGDPQLASQEAQDLYEVLYEAQRRAVAEVRPGVTAQHIDATAREIIAQAGYGDAFFHRTGHGIGLSTHEEPFIMAGNDLVLAPGMAFSVEPGIYLRGKVGARIEDIVVVTDDGVEVLNQQPRELR